MSNPTFGQALQALNLINAKDPAAERLTALYGSGILSDLLEADLSRVSRDAVRAALKLGTLVPDVFRLTVDYGQTLEQMIADGKYDCKDDDIMAKRFPIKDNGIMEFEGRYFHFNRDISSENAIKEIEAADPKNPWAAAKIEHVLSHGKIFPEEQRKFPIIGLGSVAKVRGRRYVPVLYKACSLRHLYLNWFVYDWNPFYRFLAVRKVSAS